MFVLPLTARSRAALRALAKLYRERLVAAVRAPSDGERTPVVGTAELRLMRDLCYTAACRRTHIGPYRAGVAFRTPAEAIEGLDAIAQPPPVRFGGECSRYALLRSRMRACLLTRCSCRCRACN